jgi:hypothetical protein
LRDRDLDALGEGPGFPKVRTGLDMTAFDVNAVVMAAHVWVGGRDGYLGFDGRIPEEDPGPRPRRIDASAEES